MIINGLLNRLIKTTICQYLGKINPIKVVQINAFADICWDVSSKPLISKYLIEFQLGLVKTRLVEASNLTEGD